MQDQFDGVTGSSHRPCWGPSGSLRERNSITAALVAYNISTAQTRKAWTFERHSWTGLYVRKAIFDLAINVVDFDSVCWRFFGREDVEVESPMEWYNRMRAYGVLTHPQVPTSGHPVVEINLPSRGNWYPFTEGSLRSARSGSGHSSRFISPNRPDSTLSNRAQEKLPVR